MSRERGARRERVFFGEDNGALCRELLASQCRKRGVAVVCLLLTPDHVHLILVPDRAEALGRALGERRCGEIGKRRLEVVTPAKAGVQRRRRRRLENQLFSVS